MKTKRLFQSPSPTSLPRHAVRPLGLSRTRFAEAARSQGWLFLLVATLSDLISESRRSTSQRADCNAYLPTASEIQAACLRLRSSDTEELDFARRFCDSPIHGREQGLDDRRTMAEATIELSPLEQRQWRTDRRQRREN